MSRKVLLSLIKDTVETLPVEQSFLVDLKATVSACNPKRARSTHYKPSSLNCARMVYFDKVGAPIDTAIEEYSPVRIRETGSNSHEAIQYYVSEMERLGKPCKFIDVEDYIKTHNLTYLQVKNKKQYETHLYDTRYDLSFLCDGIILYKGKYYILEIKTETDNKGMYRDSADPSHVNQSIAYSLAFGINDIIWLYEERNFCVPKTFHTVVTDEQRASLLMFFETVEQAVKDMKPPMKGSSRKACEYCVYRTECRKYR